MIVLLEPGVEEHARRVVENRFLGAGFQIFATEVDSAPAFAAIGRRDQIDLDEVRALPGVRGVRPIGKPFKLASRDFQAANTIVPLDGVTVGGEEVVLMAGPCAVESEQQVMETAAAVAASGATVLRGGAFKPRSSPYSFQGLGEEGLKILRRAADRHGLVVISELMDANHLDMMLEYVDVLQIGARNMQNFSLLRELAQVNHPVLVKRGLAATIDELLMSAEYVMSGGNRNVMVCERGIRSFQQYTRNTLDLAAVPVLRELSHLPIVIDPSHAVGVRDKVAPMARAAVAAGADGVLVEVHVSPETALCDGQQSLSPAEFAELADQLRIIASAVGRSVAGARPAEGG